jgi:hypothetical protein
MQQTKTKMAIIIFLLLLITPVGPALADSAYVDLLIPGTSRDIGAGEILIEGGFSVHDGTGHYWNASTGYRTVDIATGVVTQMANPDTWSTNYGGDPFGLYDPTNNAFYAATYFSGSETCLYKYDYSTSSWTAEGAAVNMYGGAVSNGNLYISGLREPWTGGFDSSYISLYDFSDDHRHDALIETGGASAHVAVDNAGNVYYATYFNPDGTQGSNVLYRWSAAQVAGVMNDLAAGETDTYLTLADGEKLADLPDGGGNGITVDEAGNVLVTLNDLSSGIGYLIQWDGTTGDGENYEIVGLTPDGTYFPWFGPLDIEGDFTEGDPLYGSFAWTGPITEITAVPVPAAVWLLGSGLLGLVGIRRRRAA